MHELFHRSSFDVFSPVRRPSLLSADIALERNLSRAGVQPVFTPLLMTGRYVEKTGRQRRSLRCRQIAALETTPIEGDCRPHFCRSSLLVRVPKAVIPLWFFEDVPPPSWCCRWGVASSQRVPARDYPTLRCYRLGSMLAAQRSGFGSSSKAHCATASMAPSKASILMVAKFENVSETAYGSTMRLPWRMAPQV